MSRKGGVPGDGPSAGFETRAIHGGRTGSGNESPLVPQICQSATFAIPSVRAGAEMMRGERSGAVYTRLGNPTVERLESVLAGLEDGTDALVTSSGMAAAATVLFGLLGPGDRVACSATMYGGTRELLEQELRRFGVTTTIVDTTRIERLEQAIAGGARLVWLESPANPNLQLTDLAAAARVARDNGALSVADNTFATPLLQRPLTLGIDVVVHSLTKALNGHSDVVAGAIVTADPQLAAQLRSTRTRLGGVADPHQAWLVLRGIKTLPVRVRAAQENAGRLAALLADHPAVSHVRYPGAARGAERELFERQMDGPGTMLGFELAGGADAAVRAVESLAVITLAGSLGGVESLAMHPASMSHVAMDAAELAEARIAPGLVRLSVGCESFEDLRRDVLAALDDER